MIVVIYMMSTAYTDMQQVSMSTLYIRLTKYGMDIPRSGICGYISQPNIVSTDGRENSVRKDKA